MGQDLDEHIAQLVATAPALTAEQLAALRSAFAGVVNPDPLLDRAQAAAYLGTSPRHVRMLSDSGRLPRQRIGRLLRWRRSDLDAFLAAGREQRGGAA